jgi:hypothetical protein
VSQLEIVFAPSGDVRVLLNELLNKLERRAVRMLPSSPSDRPVRPVKLALAEISLPAYYSQVDPDPRQVVNEQLQAMENAGLLRLTWQAGEKGHLLESVALVPGGEEQVYRLIERTPTASLRSRLEGLLLGERFRFGLDDWRCRALQSVLALLKNGKSPAPFSLDDAALNEDLLACLVALEHLDEETPYRVFSVRAFNDSKRFEDLKKALVRLARQGHAEWKRLPADEVLRELNLVANPSYLLLSGPWELVDTNGQLLSLGPFSPSVGLPAIQAAHLQRVNVRAEAVVCVENITTFHMLAGGAVPNITLPNPALLCLAGNPSPACRRLLSQLSDTLPEDIPLYAWADLDYGGFNILAQLRKLVSPRFTPYRMDLDTLDAHKSYARPLTQADRRNLERAARRLELRDVRPVIEGMLKRGLKLEQEAIPV